VRTFVIAASCLIARSVIAQTATPNPRQPRAALLAAEDPASVLTDLANLRLGEIRIALASGDTASLAILLGDAAIPDSERSAAAAAGCASLARSAESLEAVLAPAPVGTSRMLWMEHSVNRVSTNRDTVIASTVLAGGKMIHVPLQLTIVRSGAASRLALVRGLFLGTCTASATSPQRIAPARNK